MKNKFSHLAILGFIALVAIPLTSCSLVKKVQAAKILIHTKMDYQELTMDSVSVAPEIMGLIESSKNNFMPNPQVISLIQDLSQGIIKTELGKAHLNSRVNLNNQTKDTLWILSFKLDLELDDLVTLPIEMEKRTVLVPGDNEMHLLSPFPLDVKLFKLPDVKVLRVKGFIEVALEQNGEPVSQDFNIKYDIKPEDVEALKDYAQKALMKKIAKDWVKLIPKG
jgi:hypothetical protein